MPRAAPGDIVRGALSRKLPEYLRVSVGNFDRYPSSNPYRLRKEILLLASASRSITCSYFTLHLSGFGVECGRLGEVVSMVGDCRPPPPGNPHQPTNPACSLKWVGERQMEPQQSGSRSNCFTSIMKKNGGVFSPICMHSSFNSYQINTNLKDLNSNEYFKNKRSYFSCIVKNPVLKFEHFHSHLCGFREAEPPSIAITNVLGTQVQLCAVRIVDMMNPG
jgi:hypothetical protein